MRRQLLQSHLSVLLALVAILLPVSAVAQTASGQRIRFQGRITDDKGDPVAGTQNLVFKIYASPTATTAVWGEEVAVQLDLGVFSVVLGQTTGLDRQMVGSSSNLSNVFGDPTQSVFDGTTRFIGFGVTGQAEIGRVEVVSAPYAMNSTLLAGRRASEFVQTTGGLVGIGTSNPGVALHVKAPDDQMILENNESQNPLVQFSNHGGFLRVRAKRGATDATPDTTYEKRPTFDHNYLDGRLGINIPVQTNAAIAFGDGNGVERMRIDGSTGNVGVGTGTEPLSDLLVIGPTTGTQAGRSAIKLNNRGAGLPGPGATPSEGDKLILWRNTENDAVLGARVNHVWIKAARSTPSFDDKAFSVFTGDGTSESFTVNHDGNVGIGSTSPQAKLDVAGGIAVNGTTVIDASGQLVGGIHQIDPVFLGTLSVQGSGTQGGTVAVESHPSSDSILPGVIPTTEVSPPPRGTFHATGHALQFFRHPNPVDSAPLELEVSHRVVYAPAHYTAHVLSYRPRQSASGNQYLHINYSGTEGVDSSLLRGFTGATISGVDVLANDVQAHSVAVAGTPPVCYQGRPLSSNQDGVRLFDDEGGAVAGVGSALTVERDSYPTALRTVRVTWDGTVSARGGFTSLPDYAEHVQPVGDPSEYHEGDVLALAGTRTVSVSNAPNSRAVAGVFSAAPGLVGCTDPMCGGVDPHSGTVETAPFQVETLEPSGLETLAIAFTEDVSARYSAGDTISIGGVCAGIQSVTSAEGRTYLIPGISLAQGLTSADVDIRYALASRKEIAMAIVGIVPTKVTTENGTIAPGDLLVTSSTAAHAMKAKPAVIEGIEVYPTGAILGKAMGTLEDDGTGTVTGLIDVLVTLQ